MVVISTTYSKLKKYNYTNSIISIGSFDGMHLGHVKLLNKMNSLKKNKKNKTILITFNPHPFIKLQKNKIKNNFLLNQLDDKINLIKDNKIDVLVILSFNNKTASIKAKYFLNMIIKCFNPIHFVIGYNHTFGYKREGNIEFVKQHSESKIKVHKIEQEFALTGESISSSKIREYILNGKIELANSLIGRDYAIKGNVIRGQGIGRKIKFPTLNIDPLEKLQVIPFRGVYFVKLKIQNKLYSGMCNIGFRPTLTNSKEESIEVHIFSVEIDKDFYKKEVELFFIKYLRREKKFKNLNFLKRQLEKDKQKCLSIEI